MRIAIVSILTLCLQACGSVGGDALMVIRAAGQSFTAAPALPDFSTGLDPQFRYLWVKADAQAPALLALGFEDRTPNGLLETWYSADGSFLQTLNGRLAAYRIADRQWSSVTWVGPPPLSGAESPEVSRSRDVLPGYLYGVTDQLRNRPVTFGTVPQDVLPEAGGAAFWSAFEWSREQIVTQPATMAVPDSWLAYGGHRGLSNVVASFQCLEQNYCLKLMRWPLEPHPMVKQ